MKKTFIFTGGCVIVVFCATLMLLSLDFLSHPINASTINQTTTLDELKLQTRQMAEELATLQDTYETMIQSCQDSLERVSIVLVDYYINKLSDRDYRTVYNEGSPYYIAAENLGILGKVAIPRLIQVLDTTDDYERSLALYALLLASQQEDVKAIVGDDYIHVNLDFDTSSHDEAVKIAKAWWAKYQDQF